MAGKEAMLPMEAKVAQVEDLQDGEMREVVVGETKVLLVRLKGKFYAIGGECTHYGGPLAEGALSGHRVRCPWHQAVFDVMNGDLEEPPALDAEPCYTVRVEGDDIIVKVPEKAAGRRTPAMVRRDPADDRTSGDPGGRGRGQCRGGNLEAGWLHRPRRDDHPGAAPALRPPQFEQGLPQRGCRSRGAPLEDPGVLPGP